MAARGELSHNCVAYISILLCIELYWFISKVAHEHSRKLVLQLPTRKAGSEGRHRRPSVGAGANMLYLQRRVNLEGSKSRSSV